MGRMRRLRAVGMSFGVAGALVLGLTGCSSSNAVQETAPAMVPAPMPPGVVLAEMERSDAFSVAEAGFVEAPMAAAAMDAAGGQAIVNIADTREVIVRGNAQMRAADPLAAAAELARRVEEVGGFVEARNETRPTESLRASAYLLLRVPAAQMTATIDALSTIGEVTGINIYREDVTAIGQDLDARIVALESSTARLIALMENATDVEDLLRAERELASRQGELDSLRSSRARLSEQVAMSTLEVSIQSSEIVWTPPRTGLLGALQSGWNALVNSGHWLLVGLATALPWLLALAFLSWLGRWLWRAWRKHRDTTSESTVLEDDAYPTASARNAINSESTGTPIVETVVRKIPKNPAAPPE